MPHNEGARKLPLQLFQQAEQAVALLWRAGVCRVPHGIQSSFVADAYGVPIVSLAMGAHLFLQAASVSSAVARDVEMVTDVAESPSADVLPPASLKQINYHFQAVYDKFLLFLREILLFKMKPEVLQAIKTTLKQVLPQGAQAFLYGSRVRGDARADSDWDVLILLDKQKIQPSDYDNVSYSVGRTGLVVERMHQPRALYGERLVEIPLHAVLP